MPNCCAPHCTNNKRNGFSLFRFPRDEEMRRKWAFKVRGNSSWRPADYHSICDVHFLNSDWKIYKQRLKSQAVPSVFCECSNCRVILRESCGCKEENTKIIQQSTPQSLVKSRRAVTRNKKFVQQMVEHEYLKKEIETAEMEVRLLWEKLVRYDEEIEELSIRKSL